MATIKITRKSEFISRMRDYQIFMDEQQIGTIGNGETKNFAVSAGRHRITAKIDWCSSPDLTINVEDSDEKTLKVGGFKNSSWAMPTGLIFIVLFFVFYFFFNFTWAAFFIIPGLIVFMLLLYYLTIGKKKFLSLTEIK